VTKSLVTDTAGLSSLKRRNTVSDLDHIFAELKQSMMMGRFVPGQKLKLADLADAFGTSHMPVREALNRLVMVKALETAPRRSPSIPNPNPKQLKDILSLRIDLECKAGCMALDNDDGTLAKRLRVLNARMDAEAAKRAPNIRKYLELNQQFHFEIYRRSNNDVLLDLIELLWMRYGPLLNLLSSDGGLSFKHSPHPWHEKIIAAIENQEKTALKESISNDLNTARALIEQKIQGGQSE
jgi:DNA-binding GntR family transcriptional regulator